jgi:hypothetical protein
VDGATSDRLRPQPRRIRGNHRALAADSPRDRVAGGPRPIKLDTVYDPERSTLKIIIVADALGAAALLKFLDGFAEAVL